MPYRYTLHHSFSSLCLRFGISVASGAYIPRFNIAPNEPVSAIRSSSLLEEIDWGMVLPDAPTWDEKRIIALDVQRLQPVSNSDESILEQRCILPADGFFKWIWRDNKRQPWYFHRGDSGIFGIAGLWSQWPHKEQDAYTTCTMLTTRIRLGRNGSLIQMPAILRVENEAAWLNAITKTSSIINSDFFDMVNGLEAYPVTDKIKSAYYQNAEAIKPVTF